MAKSEVVWYVTRVRYLAPRQVDSYVLPSQRTASSDHDEPGFELNDVLLDTTLDVLDQDGDVVEQRDGVMFQF